jgi:hypothetical protein
MESVKRNTKKNTAINKYTLNGKYTGKGLRKKEYLLALTHAEKEKKDDKTTKM